MADGIVIENFPLTYIIQIAYGLRPSELVGPEWIERERFDIKGKTSTRGTTAEMLLKVRGT